MELILTLFQEMSRIIGSRTPSPVARALSPAMTLCSLRSPPVSGSHANWLEQELLRDMEPEDRWRVAIATTPRIPRRRLERVDGSPVLEIEVDLAEMSSTLPLPSSSGEADKSGAETTVPPPPLDRAIGMETTNPSLPPAGGSERGAAGEGNKREEMPRVELEGEYGGGSGWGEAHSRLAVEELQEWLSPSDQLLARSSSYEEIHWGSHEWLFPGSEPPHHHRAAPSNTTQFPPSLYELGVEQGGSRPDKRPWFVIEQTRFEEAFTQIPIPVIEPFAEGITEWDEDEASPSPLVRFAEWPREKG